MAEWTARVAEAAGLPIMVQDAPASGTVLSAPFLARMAQEIAEDIYDFAVNAGPRVSAKLAQAVAGVAPDGAIGPKTIEALERIEPATFRPLFALAKIARYRDIVTRDRSQGRFMLGWINRTLGALQ